MRKSNKPNYYQMKGRVIQQSPLYMREPPTQIITRPYLDKLYKMLKDYKYPIPIPIIPDPTTTIVMLDNTLGAFFPGDTSESHQFGIEDLKTIMTTQDKPRLPDGYHYEYAVVMYGFYSQRSGEQDNMQFHIDWHTNLLAVGDNPFQIFLKTVDRAIISMGMRTAAPYPEAAYRVKIPRYTVSSGGAISFGFTEADTMDAQPWDQTYYPIIDTRSTPTDLYYGHLEIVPNTGYIADDDFHMILTVMCFPTPN